MDKIQPKTEEWVKQAAVKGKWPNNATSTTNTFVKDGLKKRCITRDIKWGVPVPLPGYEQKVFYVWFDAPIGYLSITAPVAPEWEKWWKNPDNVELVQFIGKDNILFHSLMFPSSLIGTGEKYTLVNHLSATEFLNYEGQKFSKSNNIGLFGDQAKETNIPCEVYRYYLLANRPEQADSNFTWTDLAEKNNNELLKNLGNLSFRLLMFIDKTYKKIVPDFTNDEESNKAADEFLKELYENFIEYVKLMEAVKLKEGLHKAMNISSICNKYMQAWEPWAIYKNKPNLCSSCINTLANAFILLCAILEPFIPTFSAKVYEMFKWKRGEKEETLLGFIFNCKDFKKILGIIPPHHEISEPLPIFRESNLMHFNSK